MKNAKPIGSPLENHFKLSKEQSPKTNAEKEYMAKVPYVSTICSLMYVMICTRSDIDHAV